MPPINGELSEPDDSLRGDLEAAFADDGASDGAEVSDGVADVSGSDGSGDGASVSESNTKASQTPRAADGKFAAKPTDTKTPAVAADKAPATQDLPSTDASKASDTAAQPAAIAPPAGWTAAEKAEWSKLPPVVQAAVSRREADMTNGGRQWSEEKRRYETALSPIAQLSRARGVSVEEGAQRLASAQQMLDADPIAGIRKIAESYGVNLATLAGSPAADGSSANPQLPDIEAIVRRAMQPALAPIQQRFQAEDQRQTDMTMQTIQSFAAAEGHEHYPAVEASIALILPQVIAENPSWSADQKLQEAYDRAVYATPATRKLVLDEQNRKAEETRRTEASQRATRARGAAVSVSGAPSGSAASEAKGSLREEIMAAMNPA